MIRATFGLSRDSILVTNCQIVHIAISTRSYCYWYISLVQLMFARANGVRRVEVKNHYAILKSCWK